MTTNFYLDRRATSGDDLAQVKIALNHHGSSTYISTGIRIPPSAWDKKGQRIVKTYPNATRLNIALTTKKLDVDNAIEALKKGGRLKGLPLPKIRRAILEYLSPEEVKERSEKFLRRLERYRDSKKVYGTWITYESTVRKVVAFDKRAESLTFEDITPAWLKAFDDFMAQTSPSANARNIKLRCVRAVCKEALRDKITTNDPFFYYKIRPQATKSRVLTAEQIRDIYLYPCDEWQREYRDIFILSFFLAGINIVDLVSVRKIVNGRIEGRRAKTGQPFSFAVQPEALDIINKYKGKDWLLNVRDRYANYRDWLHRFNMGLQSLGTHYDRHGGRGAKRTGEPLFPWLSSYYARYSWATIAAELDVPNEVIDAALGHKTRGVISVYVRLNYNRKVDEACRRVIDYVFGSQP